MNRAFFFRTATALFLLGFATSSYAQAPSVPTPTPADTSATEVVYTGRLLGYFRVPSLQKIDAPAGCRPTSLPNSQAAIEFLEKRHSDYSKAILVGTGDNFAPQLEARMFEGVKPREGLYPIGNKELYFSDGESWVFYRDIKKGSTLDQKLKNGFGTIPTDNVGCFLRAAGYAAIVPGKHDFYFGAERVRQFARFLARTEKEKDSNPVQMLGANLVLKTLPIHDKPIPPRLKEEPTFKTEWDKDYPVQNLSDGASVYPWFSYVKIQIGKLAGEEKPREASSAQAANSKIPIRKEHLKSMIEAAKAALPNDEKKEAAETALDKLLKDSEEFPANPIYICPSSGSPNQLPPKEEFADKCEGLVGNEDDRIKLEGDTIIYYFSLKPLDPNGNKTNNKLTPVVPIGSGKETRVGTKTHFSTLVSGNNYGLCRTDGKTGQVNCLRFSVHRPFFYFPHYVPRANADNYTDPDPYVQIGDRAAVFGIVDPDLGSHVGILNFGWQHDNEDLTSKVSVEDPVDALHQQLDYFERQNKDGFNGLKILLAQTSPERAKVLATKFPEFQIVVSAAEIDQATNELDMSMTWKAKGKTSAFVGVPAPYFDPKTRAGAVRFGLVKAEKKQAESWALTSSPTEPKAVAEKEDTTTEFWKQVTTLPNCVGEKRGTDNPSPQAQLKFLVLCAMRERFSADVALIQSRDLFDKLPLVEPTTETDQKWLTPATRVSSKTTVDAQQKLDRLIWKGDLLTLLYVPGSALKKALELSATFDKEEKSSLSIVSDKGRKLEALGITQDKDTQEYLVNEVPLDEKKIYAVATTDFISAGDTGYPDLAKNALNPKPHPAAFPQKLVSISSVVCRKLYPEHADADCLDEIDSRAYLDKTAAAQIEPHKQPSGFKRFWNATPFIGFGKNPEPESLAEAVEQRVQRRSVWLLSLKDFSLGFNNLDNNFTDAEIDEKFGGNPTSGVQAHWSRTFRVGWDVKLSRSSHSREIFFETGADYKRQSTGDTPTKFQVSQISNRLFGDAGIVFWRRPGRRSPNFGFNVSLHTETQFQHPFATFTLNNETKDLREIHQRRSVLVVPRLGFRWENREHFAEFGIQGGRELKALEGYQFDTAGGEVTCLANSALSFAKCVTENSDTPDGITKDSPVRVLRQDRWRAGVYWKAKFSVPFGSKLKYVFDEEADWLFVKFHEDTSLDTKFRDISKHSLLVSIWPSVSIGPTLRLLLYQNKRNGNFLSQKEFGIETKVSFDIFNRRETGVQFRYTPSK